MKGESTDTEKSIATTTPNTGQPDLVKQIGNTTYKVKVYFVETSSETISDKINRMLRNEISQILSPF